MTAAGALFIVARSYLVAFFISGAVIFPILNPYYGARVLLSFGIYGVLCGLESIVTFGHVSTSGFLSGNSGIHSVRAIAVILWIALLGYGVFRSKRRP
jgi:hypothetical protein